MLNATLNTFFYFSHSLGFGNALYKPDLPGLLTEEKINKKNKLFKFLSRLTWYYKLFKFLSRLTWYSLKKQNSPLKTKPEKTTGLTLCHITSKAISQVVTQSENVAVIIFTVIKNKNKQKQKRKRFILTKGVLS